MDMHVPGRSLFKCEGMKVQVCCPALRGQAGLTLRCCRVMVRLLGFNKDSSAQFSLSTHQRHPAAFPPVQSSSLQIPNPGPSVISGLADVIPGEKEEGHLPCDHLLLTHLSHTRVQLF